MICRFEPAERPPGRCNSDTSTFLKDGVHLSTSVTLLSVHVLARNATLAYKKHYPGIRSQVSSPQKEAKLKFLLLSLLLTLQKWQHKTAGQTRPHLSTCSRTHARGRSNTNLMQTIIGTHACTQSNVPAPMPKAATKAAANPQAARAGSAQPPLVWLGDDGLRRASDQMEVPGKVMMMMMMMMMMTGFGLVMVV